MEKVRGVIRRHGLDQRCCVVAVFVNEIFEHTDRQRTHHVRKCICRIGDIHLLKNVGGVAFVERLQRVRGIRRILSLHGGCENGQIDGVLQKLGDPVVFRAGLDGILDDRRGTRRRRLRSDVFRLGLILGPKFTFDWHDASVSPTPGAHLARRVAKDIENRDPPPHEYRICPAIR